MTQNSITRRGWFAGALAAVAMMLAAGAAAQSTMKLASATINDVQHEWQKEFAKEMAARVGDAVTVEIYPASQLGAIPRMSEGVLLGTIEAFTTPTSFMTNVDGRFQAFDLPGLFLDADEVAAVIHDAEFRDYLETLFLDKGLRVIGAIYNSPILLLSREPVADLDAFQGLKVRTFASPLQMEPMKMLGANPTPLALSEVMPQLQSGGIDGMLAGMPILTAFKFHDAAENVTDLNLSQLVSLTLVNEIWFSEQSEEIQDAIRAAGRAAEQTVFPWGVQNVERANAAWTEAGGKINSLPEAQQVAMMQGFAELGSSLIADQSQVVELHDRIFAILQARRGG
ncbi:TRAP transporter substrate-binding protein [Sedimentitalea todarodis]|uniref:TRAP transporter substrate-binding protein n=1 Tax=Sedimentitalea todarodis TaxID=1631240 RepID=A0ABU3VKK8_9RHOB|nr:TRAP transporter substrate-binding protein [Sedimentitalea todarodis]MDU9006710.1 TRAP transporter substrate-binding protein [Sedimentitalea todarodis]